jgi:hypothetical protein
VVVYVNSCEGCQSVEYASNISGGLLSSVQLGLVVIVERDSGPTWMLSIDKAPIYSGLSISLVVVVPALLHRVMVMLTFTSLGRMTPGTACPIRMAYH